MSELFDIEESLSPRMKWVHGMKAGVMLTHYNADCENPWCAILVQTEDKGKTIGLIMAESCRLYDEAGLYAEGSTEIDAMEELAVKNNLKLWNEK